MTMANGERFKGYADGICRHFKALLKPHPYFWNLWVDKEMPWVAYLTLYYGAFDGKRFYEEFHYLSERGVRSSSDRWVIMALKNYSLVTLIMKMRISISCFLRKIKK